MSATTRHGFRVSHDGRIRHDADPGARMARVYRTDTGWEIQRHRGVGMWWEVVVTGARTRAAALTEYREWLDRQTCDAVVTNVATGVVSFHCQEVAGHPGAHFARLPDGGNVMW